MPCTRGGAGLTISLILDTVYETKTMQEKKKFLDTMVAMLLDSVVSCPNRDTFLESKKAFFITDLRHQS